jgi:hypothetical protein
MKSISAAAITAMENGDAISVGAMRVGTTSPVCIWSGYGPISLPSGSGGALETYDGIGDRGLIQITGATLGTSEQNITLTLSGVEPDVLMLWDAAGLQGSICQIWLLTFDGAGQTLLDAHIFAAGRLDTMPITDVVGGTSTITASVETAARGLGRSGQRMRTDADQRLINSADNGFQAVSFAGNKTLYWGGQFPTSASTLGWTPINTPVGYGGYGRI